MKTDFRPPLPDILSDMQQLLGSLKEMMLAEQQQLISAHPDSYRLQNLAEDKQAALNTLDYLDKQRMNAGTAAGLQAPYLRESALHARWQQIHLRVTELQQMNQHTALLLQQQMDRTAQALTLLHPLQTQALYGPDGQGR
ncbi:MULTISPECIES: flagella synthesis protein FlgN [Tatumella]|uniref:Flagella synthesis protein FlgN n=1 Tax=Tatumella terrea TaxID=419007 RepID=A0ABW1VXU8_9GAMM|nr:flagellar export chaperone FlgN [Tatumella sp. JGM118]